MKGLNKKITILILALVLALSATVFVACDGDDGKAKGGDITYTVTIERSGGEPFSNILVVVLGTNYLGRTDSDGKWSFTAPKGTYNLMFEVPDGYEGAGYSITAEEPDKKFTLYAPPKLGCEVGDICNDFELNCYNDREKVKLSELCGENAENAKIVVVNLWGTWCGPCVSELPEFEKVRESRDDVEMIAIHSVYGSSGTSVQTFLNNKGWNEWGIIFAQDTGTADQSDVYALLGGSNVYPRTVVIDKNGKITAAFDGQITEEKLTAAIEQASSETIEQ